jgi:hypothetical protein
MSTPLQELLESEEMENLVEQNQELLNEINEATEEFIGLVTEFVHQNPDVFLDESVENIAKNIRIFTEVSVMQFLTEITAMNQDRVNEPLTPENALSEYI